MQSKNHFFVPYIQVPSQTPLFSIDSSAAASKSHSSSLFWRQCAKPVFGVVNAVKRPICETAVFMETCTPPITINNSRTVRRPRDLIDKLAIAEWNWSHAAERRKHLRHRRARKNHKYRGDNFLQTLCDNAFEPYGKAQRISCLTTFKNNCKVSRFIMPLPCATPFGRECGCQVGSTRTGSRSPQRSR